jgi:LruC domain-containing protein
LQLKPIKNNFMKSLKTLVLSTAFILTALVGCKKSNSDDPVPIPEQNGIPDSFSYATTRDLSVSVRLLTNSDKPIAGALVDIADPNHADRIYLKAISDENGYVRADIKVPSYLDTLVINPNYVGLVNNLKSLIKDKTSISIIAGGQFSASGDIIPEVFKPRISRPDGLLSTISAGTSFSLTYGYPSGYTSSNDAILNTSNYPFALGRPKYLEPTPDVIEASLLNYVNASLPEGKPLTTSHPEYLTTSVANNIVVKQASDVFITFVSEGAGYYNTLAYYSYDTDDPPLSVTSGGLFGGIDKITMVFPNASAFQSGGGLTSGDKVKLGKFDAGTTIAFVLIQNAWTGSGISTSGTKFYSESKFNPEGTVAKRKHSVILHDNVHNAFIIGFEDINRDSNSDNDFNDLVVYATSNPISGISNTNIPAVDKGGDTDGDGVLDQLDAFPNDPSKAFITYAPSLTEWSTLAFEDNWPNKGDYDLNDLVVNYRYTFVSNSRNGVVEMTGEYQPVAAGAAYKNGFGVQFPIAASAVASVSGQSLLKNYIQLGANQVEAGQSRAVIIPFDNHENLLKNPDGFSQVNTDLNRAKVVPSKATVNIRFTSPIPMATLGTAPFNPFLIVNQIRGTEIHLPNNAPTDRATAALFGTGEDNTTSATGRFYLSKENSPWGLSFTDAFTYPTEGKPIHEAYLHFNDWVKSGGVLYKDWYVNTGTGYRNSLGIYNK